MALELIDFAYSREANADLSTKQFFFVKIQTTGKIAVVATAGVDHDGVLQDKPSADGRVGKVVKSGITKVVTGTGGSTRGSAASIDANGKAIVADSPQSVGIFLDTVPAGAVATLLLDDGPSMKGRISFGSLGYRQVVLSADDTLVATSEAVQLLDANGANRNITLPALAVSRGLFYWIKNEAAGAFNLVVKDAAAATIVTLNQNEAALVVCNGTAWKHGGVLTIALT